MTTTDAGPPAQPGEFAETWRGMEGIFGGFVLARLVDLADSVEGYRPQAVNLHFVSAVHPGDVETVAEIVHRGRATVSMRLGLYQDGRARVHAMASLARESSPVRWDRAIDTAVLPDPATLAEYEPAHSQLSYGENLEIRPVSAPTMGDGARAWIRLRSDRSDHALGGPHAVAAVLLDALPPGLFAMARRPRFVPTIDFSIHYAAGLAEFGDNWHYVVNETAWTSDEFCVDQSALYDRSGRLLAQVRQGRAIRWPS